MGSKKGAPNLVAGLDFMSYPSPPFRVVARLEPVVALTVLKIEDFQ